MLKRISKEELAQVLTDRPLAERLELPDILLENMDLSGWDLHNINFNKSNFCDVDLSDTNMSYVKAQHVFFGGSTLHGANLTGACLREADLRHCDLSGADMRGADLFAAALFKASLTGIRVDEHTRFFHLYCPEKGAFIGWKVCYGRKIVQLLVPGDAVRISGTTNEVKCDKAKVLSIKSADYKESYKEAHSYVDENFVYRVGETVYAHNFNPDRFVESGGGIHIWLTREEAIAYLG